MVTWQLHVNVFFIRAVLLPAPGKVIGKLSSSCIVFDINSRHNYFLGSQETSYDRILHGYSDETNVFWFFCTHVNTPIIMLQKEILKKCIVYGSYYKPDYSILSMVFQMFVRCLHVCCLLQGATNGTWKRG